MSAVNITNVAVLDNPAAFLNPFQFEISYECLVPLTDGADIIRCVFFFLCRFCALSIDAVSLCISDLEWKLIYVGSAEDEKYDQLLESVLVGPVNVGNYRRLTFSDFAFQADPPDPTKIREEDILGVTVLLLTCSYIGQEFIRVGYYVNNDYDDEQLREEPPTRVLIDRVQRNILADKPRVTKFPINFHPESNENGVQPAVNPSPEAINGDEQENDLELEIKVKIDAGVQPAGHPSPEANNADGPENHSALDIKKKIEV
ncbi:hypothetical protein IEQ34_004722 [Dendrobium chrysotoxum]|uniref:Histone chaperone ASF1A n=1 Tax=Dendrobium chrysotoxum TaxID=161865 RepID=A0AAV7HH89_DENCH|nr:hypothetical protein IEQ34_004722 [Dendrobium chrysotoxum]